EFNAVIDKACRAEVSERYQTAEQMHEELAWLQGGRSVTRKRAAQRRRGAAKQLGFVACALACLVLPLRFLGPPKPGHTPTPEALRLYKLGQWYYNQLTPEDHGKALNYLTQAIRADPQFTQPYAELAALYTWNILPGVSSEQDRHQRTQEIAHKALAI